MTESSEIPITPSKKSDFPAKPTKFWTPLKQRIAAFSTAIGLAVPTGVAAWQNSHKPDSLPNKEPIVRVVEDETNIKMYLRESNSRVQDWENKVKQKIESGSITNLNKIDIKVNEGSESVKIRTIPFLGQPSGLQSDLQAEILPGTEISFYGFNVNDQLESLDTQGNGDWFVVFLEPTNKEEKAYLGFINVGPLTEESVNKESILYITSGMRFDAQGFPVSKISGQDQRIGYIPNNPTPSTP